MAVSSEAANPLSALVSGRGNPGGGIKPTRTLRITFSTCSVFCSGCDKSILVQEKPPDFNLSLWHPAQYLVTSTRSAETVMVAVVWAERTVAHSIIEVEVDKHFISIFCHLPGVEMVHTSAVAIIEMRDDGVKP